MVWHYIHYILTYEQTDGGGVSQYLHFFFEKQGGNDQTASTGNRAFQTIKNVIYCSSDWHFNPL